MHKGTGPEMSVILVTPDRYETIRKTIRHLRVQTARDMLELVIVAPSAEKLELAEAELADFQHIRVVDSANKALPEARAEGIWAATAPVVVLGEDHSYPEPRWAEMLIEAHRGPWAAVGPAVRNANPRSITSWAYLFLCFGSWVEPVAEGVTRALPSHNSAYKRAVLMEYGEHLPQMLEVESFLHQDLQAKGYQLYLQPAARTYHVNISRLGSFMQELYHSGRLFGAARARYGRWSRLRRLVYTGGGPLIPFISCRRVVREIRRSSQSWRVLPLALPVLMAGLTAHSVGEMVGYAFGPGAAAAQKSAMETHRDRFLTKRDRRTGAGR